MAPCLQADREQSLLASSDSNSQQWPERMGIFTVSAELLFHTATSPYVSLFDTRVHGIDCNESII